MSTSPPDPHTHCMCCKRSVNTSKSKHMCRVFDAKSQTVRTRETKHFYVHAHKWNDTQYGPFATLRYIQQNVAGCGARVVPCAPLESEAFMHQTEVLTRRRRAYGTVTTPVCVFHKLEQQHMMRCSGLWGSSPHTKCSRAKAPSPACVAKLYRVLCLTPTHTMYTVRSFWQVNVLRCGSYDAALRTWSLHMQAARKLQSMGKMVPSLDRQYAKWVVEEAEWHINTIKDARRTDIPMLEVPTTTSDAGANQCQHHHHNHHDSSSDDEAKAPTTVTMVVLHTSKTTKVVDKSLRRCRARKRRRRDSATSVTSVRSITSTSSGDSVATPTMPRRPFKTRRRFAPPSLDWDDVGAGGGAMRNITATTTNRPAVPPFSNYHSGMGSTQCDNDLALDRLLRAEEAAIAAVSEHVPPPSTPTSAPITSLPTIPITTPSNTVDAAAFIPTPPPTTTPTPAAPVVVPDISMCHMLVEDMFEPRDLFGLFGIPLADFGPADV